MCLLAVRERPMPWVAPVKLNQRLHCRTDNPPIERDRRAPSAIHRDSPADRRGLLRLNGRSDEGALEVAGAVQPDLCRVFRLPTRGFGNSSKRESTVDSRQASSTDRWRQAVDDRAPARSMRGPQLRRCSQLFHWRRTQRVGVSVPVPPDPAARQPRSEAARAGRRSARPSRPPRPVPGARTAAVPCPESRSQPSTPMSSHRALPGRAHRSSPNP